MRVFEKKDIKAGQFTVKQRVEMDSIFRSGKIGLEMYYDTIECLHGFRPTTEETMQWFDYLQQIIDGFLFWIEKEKLIKRVDINMIALARNVEPEEVWTWSYRTVYEIILLEF